MEKTIYNIRKAYSDCNEYGEYAICYTRTNLFFDNQVSAYDYIKNTLIPQFIENNIEHDNAKRIALAKENKGVFDRTQLYNHENVKDQVDIFTVHECILMGIPEPTQPIGYCYYKEHDMCGCM